MIAAGNKQRMYSAYSVKENPLELFLKEEVVTIVRTREEWEKEIATKGFMKTLAAGGLVGKENAVLTPFELLNDCTYASCLADGKTHELRLEEDTDPK